LGMPRQTTTTSIEEKPIFLGINLDIPQPLWTNQQPNTTNTQHKSLCVYQLNYTTKSIPRWSTPNKQFPR
jgi:hypothetical protein